MARAAVIPGVSADLPQQRSTRGRGRNAAASTEAQDVKKAEPAKRGRKPGKTTTTTATTTTTKNKKSVGVGNNDGDDEDEDDDDLSLDVVPAKKSAATTAAAVKSRPGRPPRQVTPKPNTEDGSDEEDDDDDELAAFEVPKKKVGRPKATKAATTTTTTTSKAQSTATAASKPTRGRPKTVKVNEQENQDEAATTEKKTRGRRPAARTTDKTIYVATASTASSLAKARTLGDPAKKKKVTFADLAGSEDESSGAEQQQQQKPVKSVAKKSTAADKSTGLKAKPVRKVGTATRGRPPKSQAAATTKPLSPKKSTQLAKASASSASSGEEDELASEKTIYSLIVQKSPVKTQEPQHTGLSSPVKRIMLPGQASTPARPTYNTNQQDENGVPSMQKPELPSALHDAAYMGSPARRPPPSTSKETIRDTPRRGPLFINHTSASNLSNNAATGAPTQNMSPLKASPKKGGNLGASFFSASPEKGSASLSTPFNAKLSLLKSPAKRIQSPFIFQKPNTKPQAESITNDDVDTDMQDDIFTDTDKVDVVSHSFADEMSDDELSMDRKPAYATENHDFNNDDVFEERSAAEEGQTEEYDHEVASDAEDEQNVTETAEDHTETLSEEHAADDDVEAVNEQQHAVTVDEEDVEMNEDEVYNEDDEDLQQEQPEQQNVQNEQDSEVRANDEEINQNDHIVDSTDRHSTAGEFHDEPDHQADVQCTEEDVEQVSTMNDTEEQSEHPVEDDIPESHPVTMYAEPDDENEDTLPEIETPLSVVMLASARSSIEPREVMNADEVDEVESVSAEMTPKFIPPAAPTPPQVSPTRTFRMSYRDNGDEDTNSEYGSSPVSRRQSIFSGRDSILPQPTSDSADDTFTSLAAQLSSWKASSPEKSRKHTPERSIFFPVIPSKLANPRQSMQGSKYSQIQTMRQSLAARHSTANSVVMDNSESDTINRESQPDTSVVEDEQQPEPSQVEGGTSQTSSDQQEKTKPRVSMSITPVRINRDAYRTVHTVSKVPLRPEGDESPIKYPRKRVRSLSIDIELPIRASPNRFKLVPKSRKSGSPSPSTKRTPLADIKTDEAPQQSDEQENSSVAMVSPAKTPRKEKAEQQFLRGAVVFVDVHTTEGEDASGIFIELLTQMGAKCVRSWAWNPRASHSPGADGSETALNSSKVGITHVVYKDGGVRTMEKVRQAGDLVKCVGVGWVLDCERANKWMDEAHYYVDNTIIPRGGAKRRKSMQPRALANVNGSLTSSTSSSSSLPSSIGHNSSTSSNRRSQLPTDWEDTMEDFRRISPSSSTNDINGSVPKTPTSLKMQSNNSENTENNNNENDDSEYNFNFNFDFSAMSPATPGFLSQNTRLVQQTCPPKQTNQGLFSSMLSSTGRNNDNHNIPDDDLSSLSSGANLRAKLEAARRKSLAFKPRFGSPLSRS